MRGHGTTTQQAGVRLLAAAGLPLGLTGATVLGAALTVRLRALLPVDIATATVDRVVEIGVLSLGIALVAWLVWGLAVATLCAAARAVGVTWRAGERAVARHAPGLVRRALVVALGAGLGVSGAVTAHATAPGDGLDVGWSATTSTAPASGTATAPLVVGAPSDASSAAVEQPGTDDLGTDAPGTDATPTPAATTPVAAAPGAPVGAHGAGDVADGTEADGAGAPTTTATASGSTTAAPGAGVDTGVAPPATGASGHGVTRTTDPGPGPTTAHAPTATSTATGLAGGATTSTAPAGTSVVVLAGDSLWRIAQRALGPDATDQEVAAEWPRWYAANADVIGADPDHVVPGQVLRAPDPAATHGSTR